VNTQTSAKPDKPQRRWDLDWLRVIGTILILAFHSAQPFNPGFDWEIQNAERSPAFVSDWTSVAVADYRADLVWTPLLMSAYGSAEPRQIILRAYEWIAGREAVRLEGRAGQSGSIKTRSFVVEPSVIRHRKRPLNERSFVVDQNLLPDRCVPVRRVLGWSQEAKRVTEETWKRRQRNLRWL
jgi:hypothetical protein